MRGAHEAIWHTGVCGTRAQSPLSHCVCSVPQQLTDTASKASNEAFPFKCSALIFGCARYGWNLHVFQSYGAGVFKSHYFGSGIDIPALRFFSVVLSMLCRAEAEYIQCLRVLVGERLALGRSEA